MKKITREELAEGLQKLTQEQRTELYNEAEHSIKTMDLNVTVSEYVFYQLFANTESEFYVG